MKKGFTLIELLAVIVLIAVIGLITTPVINNVLEDSKKKSFQNSVEGIYDVVNQDYTKNEMKGTYGYSYNNGILTLINKNGQNIAPIIIKTEGKLTGNGTIDIDSEGNIIVAIENNKYCAYTTKDDTNVQLNDGNCNDIKMADCFDYEDNVIIDSYDINHDGCFNYFINGLGYPYGDDQLELVCAGGIDDYGISISYIVDTLGFDQLTFISNIRTHTDGIKITEYKCGGYYDDEDNYIAGSEMNPVIPSKIDGKSVRVIGNVSFSQTVVDSVDYSKKVLIDNVTIPNSVTSIGTAAFQSNKLTSVIIPDSVTSIGSAAFNSNLLTNATIGNSVTSIGDYAFYSNQLTSITIPDNVTNIGNYAFESNQLTSVTIPDSVTSIGSWAFAENKLITVTLGTSLISIGSSAFDKTANDNPLTIIYNNSGNPFDWTDITDSSTAEQSFITGTIIHQNGNIAVTTN